MKYNRIPLINCLRHIVLYICSTVVCLSSASQSIQLGDKLTGVVIPGIISQSFKSLNLDNLKGKVVILDFWATWCAPCLSSFAKMEQFKKTFGEKLSIIAVSEEQPRRLEAFIQNRPLPFIVAADTGKTLQRFFPHGILPHVILIDSASTVRAITNGAEVTEGVIAQVINGRTPSVSFKVDNLEFNYETYFKPDSKTTTAFTLTRAIPGGAAQIIPGTGVFTHRRKSFFNVPFATLFMHAYGFGHRRTKYKQITKDELSATEANLYCVDVIVDKKGERHIQEYMQKELSKILVYKAKVEARTDTVYFIRKKGAVNFGDSTISKDRSDQMWGRKGLFSGKGIRLKRVADYLENLSILKLPVIADFDDSNYYDLEIPWEHEKPNGIKDFLDRLGLYVEKGVAKIDYLIIYK